MDTITMIRISCIFIILFTILEMLCYFISIPLMKKLEQRSRKVNENKESKENN